MLQEVFFSCFLPQLSLRFFKLRARSRFLERDISACHALVLYHFHPAVNPFSIFPKLHRESRPLFHMMTTQNCNPDEIDSPTSHAVMQKHRTYAAVFPFAAAAPYIPCRFPYFLVFIAVWRHFFEIPHFIFAIYASCSSFPRAVHRPFFLKNKFHFRARAQFNK